MTTAPETPATESPAAIRAKMQKGQEAFAAGDFVNALKYFVEWSNIDRDNHKSREHIAEALHKLGRTDQAIAMYKTVASAYLAAGSIIKAIAIHKTILLLDPQDQEIKGQLLSIFGNKIPEELAGVVKTKGEPAKAAAAAKKPAKGAAISAEDLGLDEVDAKPPAGGLDALNTVFSEILGEETSLVDFRAPKAAPLNPLEAFQRTPLFSDLRPDELNALIDQLKLAEIPDAQIVCKEGDPGNMMWVIVQGEAQVRTQKKDGTMLDLATLSESDFFGEGGFVTGHPRTASIFAKGPLKLLEITKANFDAACKMHPRMQEVLEVFYHNRLADRALAQSELFGSLPSFRRAELLQTFKRQAFRDLEVVFKEGGKNDLMYLVKAGKIEILTGDRLLTILGPGEVFGEVGLLGAEPSPYMARARGDADLLTLRKIDVDGVIQMFPETEAIFKRYIDQRKAGRWDKV